MITSAIISMFGALLSGLIALLPAMTALPDNIDSALSYFVPIWSSWNNILPLTDLFIILTSILSIELIVLTFHVVDWIYNKIRGSG